MAVTATSLTPPLCVDLDRTLIRSDSLSESLIALLRQDPLAMVSVPGWCMQGKAVLQRQIAQRIEPNAAALPYNKDLLAWLKAERAAGRSIWLCTDADERFATAVSEHLGLFDGVLASDSRTHLSGAAQAQKLAAQFGAQGFEYCGGSATVGAVARIVKSFPARTDGLGPILRLLRPHQWAKNALLPVPLLAAHGIGGEGAWLNVLLAFIAFNLCASSVYVLNDTLDVESDRLHPRKSKRPLASGEVSLRTAFVLAPCLLAAAAVLTAFLAPRFQTVLACYAALTSAYSFYLKGLVLVDAICLAGLYTLRIIAGAAAAQVPLSFWLLLFSVFLFLSLAFVKRYAELDALRRQLRLNAAGRGYHVEDLPVLQSLGSAAGYLSVLVLALYINSPAIEGLYSRPKYIWALCVLMLFWISRVWMKAHRGTMHDDPVVFALKDRVSLAVGLAAAATVAIAI